MLRRGLKGSTPIGRKETFPMRKNPQEWPAGKYRVEMIDHGSRRLKIRTPKGAFSFFGVPHQRMSQIVTASERGDSDQVRYLLNLSGTYSDTVAANPRKEKPMRRRKARKKNPRRKAARNPKALKVGDWVKYSRAWLRSVGISSGSIPFARGPITGMIPLGSITLATIDWGDPEIPDRVNVKNLAAAKAREIENPQARRKAKHNPAACNNPGHAHRNTGLAGIMDKREAAKARSFR